MNIKSKIVAMVYEHIELCSVCGKEGQSTKETVYIPNSPNPQFHRANIPVG